ncbi:MAG: aldo/keto reductase [Leptolinea sp.]|jgi:voltage-dependent potassium channel beta subunit|nr:aldo/keto reductase [Leptolinea sp.]
MHYRRLGHTGIKISEISLGSWITFGSQIKEEMAIDLVRAAYDQGVNFFDCADMYAGGKAEVVLGKAIKNLPREDLILSSKVFYPTSNGPNGRGLSRKHITESLDASLKRLGTEYVDLYFCHRYDPDTSIEEVVRTMDDLVHRGKVLYWGTSEWEAGQAAQAYGIARQYWLIPPSMEQPQYNMFRRRRVEWELAPLCKDFGLGLTTYSPLFFGILTGKYNEGIPAGSRASLEDMAWIRDNITPENINKVRQLTNLADQIGMTTAQLSIAWILRRKDVSSVITGATHLEQLDENLDAGDMIDKMTDDVLEKIEKILGTSSE